MSKCQDSDRSESVPILKIFLAQSAGAVEYTDCIFVEG